MYSVDFGFPVLGATVLDTGINFGIYCKNKKNVILNIYDFAHNTEPTLSLKLDEKINKTGDIWHIFLRRAKEGVIYSWKIDDSPELLDPYAFSYTNHKECKNKKSIAVKKELFKERHLDTPMSESIIYEVHIKLFTQNSNSLVKFPGKYKGFMEKIPYLKELGITAVEFLPVYEWDEYTGRYDSHNKVLENVWGYNPISFFAPTKKFSSKKNLDSFDEVIELKELIKELHKNGIEVILDVVYNHTAEGGNGGHLYNFKAMNKSGFYILEKDGENYTNYSGCGNTFNCNTVMSKDIILNSLKYWYLDMGVDGFRFDLAPILGRDEYGQWGGQSVLNEIAQDPILSHCKLISESWDLGGYYVGDMPAGWSEWNGKYRDVVRKFIKGDFGQISDLVKRISGSPDIFKRGNRSPYNSINFISCHDGFTLYDLVSYNTKHNLNNGENNRDGENHNNSYNWGEEGETKNTEILNLRKKLIKNFFLILMISQGTPMFLMGDECGRTQHGNNNAYCQDNKSTWLDWERAEEFKDIYNFVKNMIKLRKSYSIFKKDSYWECDDCKASDVILHGTKLHSPDFSYHSLSIAFELKDINSDTKFYVALNSYYGDLQFELPPLEKGKKWYALVDTSKEDKYNFSNTPTSVDKKSYLVKSRSSIILISK